MTEQHESYRVSANDVPGVVNQLNQLFNLLASRLDKIEGLRGSPTFYDSAFQYPGQSISGFLKAGTEAASFDSVTTSDLGLSYLELGTSYIKIIDANSVVIHQMGDE